MLLGGCASQTRNVVRGLDTKHETYRTESCQSVVRLAKTHDDIGLIRLVASPAILIVSGGTLLLPVLGANAGFDFLDRSDASHVSVSCGGHETPKINIVEKVVIGIGFGFLTSSVKISGN